MSKPTCKVHGMIQPRVMCGHIIVGLKYCGFSGDCQHKSCAEMVVEHVKEQPATTQGIQDKEQGS